MRRAIARGRLVPQSLSTDPRVGCLSLKAALLFPLMWINCDDQGRISGNPSEVKYVACPNIDHITKEDIPGLLKELQTQELIKVYSTSKVNAIQMLDWWEEQKLQWAYPSRYPPPEGWTDHLRYHPTPTEIITESWPPAAQPASKLLPSKPASALGSNHRGKKSKSRQGPLPSPEIKKEKEKEEEEGRLPSALGSNPSPSPTADISEILKELTECFEIEWGRVPAGEPEKVIRREPAARESAQLRDLAKNLSAAGGVPLNYIREAFREAASHQKCHITYVRAILLDWLNVPRGPP
jgi:hypothetical protein